MDNRISCIGVEAYRVDALESAVEEHFRLLDVWGGLRPGMAVLLKPNLLKKHEPDHAVTTHPNLVEAVARVLQRHGIEDIALADSPGGPYSKALLQSVYAAGGMQGVAERTGIRLNTGVAHREVAHPGGSLCHSFPIIDPVAEADYIINLPKLKTHAMTGLSGGVKNLFGCVPGLQKPELHYRFPERERFGRMLVDLAELVKPGVTLVDAVVAMEGDGPSGGEPRQVGLTLAAQNPHALDLGLCGLIGMPPLSVPTVAWAVEAGLCPPEEAGLSWLGEGKPETIADFRHPRSKSLLFSRHAPRILQGPMAWAERRFLSPRPVIDRRACIGCGKCEESCAPRAVVIRQGKAVLDSGACIRCYCCQEMCPVKAVRIRRTGLFRF